VRSVCVQIVRQHNIYSGFSIPANILKWIISFVTDRLQSTKVNSVCSSVTAITDWNKDQLWVHTALSFMLMIFKVVGLLNSGVKYDDNFTPIVPENTDVSAEDKMRNVLLWSDDNKLSS